MTKENLGTSKFRKHQTSKYKKYVGTYPNGTRFQSNTQEDLREQMANYDQGIKSNGSKSKLFDPETGKPIE